MKNQKIFGMSDKEFSYYNKPLISNNKLNIIHKNIEFDEENY